jgi:hypothetical protein
MSHHELMDPVLVPRMKLLNFMICFKPVNVQTVGQHSVGLSLEQVFTFTRSNFTDGSEVVAGVSAGILDGGFRLNTKFCGLFLPLEERKVSIKKR